MGHIINIWTFLQFLGEFTHLKIAAIQKSCELFIAIQIENDTRYNQISRFQP